MDSDWILRIVLFGIIHWILAGVLLQDLTTRGRVFGGKKSVWALMMLFIPCFGSVVYLLFHPKILNPDATEERQQEIDNPGAKKKRRFKK